MRKLTSLLCLPYENFSKSLPLLPMLLTLFAFSGASVWILLGCIGLAAGRVLCCVCRAGRGERDRSLAMRPREGELDLSRRTLCVMAPKKDRSVGDCGVVGNIVGEAVVDVLWVAGGDATVCIGAGFEELTSDETMERFESR